VTSSAKHPAAGGLGLYNNSKTLSLI